MVKNSIKWVVFRQKAVRTRKTRRFIDLVNIFLKQVKPLFGLIDKKYNSIYLKIQKLKAYG